MQRAATGLARSPAPGERAGRVVRPRVVLLVGSGNNGGDALSPGRRLARRGAPSRPCCCRRSRTPRGSRRCCAAGGRRGHDAGRPWRTRDLVVDGIVGIGGRGGLRPEAAPLLERVGPDRGRRGRRPPERGRRSTPARSPARLCGPTSRSPSARSSRGCSSTRARRTSGVSSWSTSGSGRPRRPPWSSRRGGRRGARAGRCRRATATSTPAGSSGVAAGSAGVPRRRGAVRRRAPCAPGRLVGSPPPRRDGGCARTGPRPWSPTDGCRPTTRSAGSRPGWSGRAWHRRRRPGRLARGPRRRRARRARRRRADVVSPAPGLLACRRARRRRAHPARRRVRRLLGVAREDVEAARLAHARAAAAELGRHGAAQGPTTLVADPAGPVRVNPTGAPWLGTAGSGDVLAGTGRHPAGRRPDPLDAARRPGCTAPRPPLASAGGPPWPGTSRRRCPRDPRRCLSHGPAPPCVGCVWKINPMSPGRPRAPRSRSTWPRSVATCAICATVAPAPS